MIQNKRIFGASAFFKRQNTAKQQLNGEKLKCESVDDFYHLTDEWNNCQCHFQLLIWSHKISVILSPAVLLTSTWTKLTSKMVFALLNTTLYVCKTGLILRDSSCIVWIRKLLSWYLLVIDNWILCSVYHTGLAQDKITNCVLPNLLQDPRWI